MYKSVIETLLKSFSRGFFVYIKETIYVFAK